MHMCDSPSFSIERNTLMMCDEAEWEFFFRWHFEMYASHSAHHYEKVDEHIYSKRLTLKWSGSSTASTAIRHCALIYTVRIEHCYPITSNDRRTPSNTKHSNFPLTSEKKLLLETGRSSIRHCFGCYFHLLRNEQRMKKQVPIYTSFGLFLVNFLTYATAH